MNTSAKLLIAGVVLAMVMLFVYSNKQNDIQANSGIQSESESVQLIETGLSSTALMNGKPSAGVTAVSDPGNPIIKIQTSFGDLKIELYRAYAPEIVAEFTELINRNYYVKDTVLESKRGLGFVLAKTGDEMKTFADFKDTLNDLRGIRGSVAVLKHTVSPAYLNNIFIGYQSNPDLRDNYIVFGQVLEGVDDIENKASHQGQVNAMYVDNREKVGGW